MNINDILELFGIGLSGGVGLGLIPFIISYVVKKMFGLFDGNTDLN